MPSATSSVSVTTSVKFQQKLKETKNFGDALVEVFADLARLEIVTWVAHDGDADHKAGNRLKTTINLIDGDIENELGADFLQGSPYAELRDFHELQVQKGAETIANNLKTLVGISQKVTDLLNHKRDEEKFAIGADDNADDFRRDRLPSLV
ncbi:hypothetical protein HCU40_05405 [Pseudanabaena biceps]|nr:hypothetical protein [Pseudanabaena biceps]